jgi:hypothetical protein
VAVDSSGSVYVAEINDCDIRKGVPASLAVSLPLLTGIVANNQILLEWATTNVGFTLQSSRDLDNWTDITGNPFVLESQFVVTNPISEGAQFFRLKK